MGGEEGEGMGGGVDLFELELEGLQRVAGALLAFLGPNSCPFRSAQPHQQLYYSSQQPSLLQICQLPPALGNSCSSPFAAVAASDRERNRRCVGIAQLPVEMRALSSVSCCQSRVRLSQARGEGEVEVLFMAWQESPMAMEAEEQIMILLDDYDEENPDLLDVLGAPPANAKKSSYEYHPDPSDSDPSSPLPDSPPLASPMDCESPPEPMEEETDREELKTSNRSAATSCGESEAVVRRCTCLKTRCLKNYCECFKMGVACNSECACFSCCNREKLFLTRPTPPEIKCKCQKSHCLKKYCECHSSGRKCGPLCKCLHCQNGEQEDLHSSCNYLDHRVFLDI